MARISFGCGGVGVGGKIGGDERVTGLLTVGGGLVDDDGLADGVVTKKLK